MRARGAFHWTRSFFSSSPPLPPGLKPTPAASDAKPFFASGADASDGPSLPSAASPPKGDGVDGAGSSDRGDSSHAEAPQQQPHRHWPSFFSPDTIPVHVPKPAKLAALLAADALGIPTKRAPGSGSDQGHSSGSTTLQSSSGALRKEYREHCVLGWSPSDLYRVVADVAQYSTFLPWCLDSTVHSVRRLDADEMQMDGHEGCRDGACVDVHSDGGPQMEMDATLTVGFSFFKEKYTSRVLLVPNKKVRAVLKEDPKQQRCPVLSDLHCVWEFNTVPGSERQVEVRFLVSFAFKNPLHSSFIMSHIVTLMTRSFERHCEKLYGPPSCQRERLAAK